MVKTWFITGTSSGLGRLLAERLLQRGDRVVATLRHEGALDELKQQYDDRLHVLTLDVTDIREVHTNISAAFEAMGRIDVVVNNAGYGLFGAAEEVTDEQIERQIATNLTGSIQVIRAALPHLRRQGGGRIVQVSSEGGQIAYPNFSLYHATKWGIEGFVESVAKEVGPFGIDFVIVEPGPTSTQFGAGLDHAVPMPEYDDTPAGDVRRAIASNSFAIRGDAGRTVTAMIVAADSAHPPLRLTLGGGAYDSIRAALAERLRVLEAQKDIAFSVDSIS
ncbi:3-phenylpropionate-dihydrodiol/cinnamic acid-dihydrodiol dehydrogenase [Paraburkholderia aspalathi]|uniref:3-phenylpropionate-dihydrodiol/cinnamic acid-dihydrodiol dehydrogenase n=1 Tax=Paraburkholderia aspalathi TaxID=1324617 RepID=A0ABN7LDA0_9BURK|nr:MULTISPECIES: SDR family oxidoreductase [Paraburkholderia]MCP2090361.1 NAD(P)-dependent dehydrogenase (short-subunit alcohol dehydrogenase family) [Paraburkholderia sediminicola]MBK3818939.1 SDR family oxidoreductase [Paraburkholderia aspalathi]MBK3830793.1 SDR family oxidoreductase [Paraburkholderia aspalathi]MBK3860494.1 SDR family oxidoreductase [Paraburkholderia aspalathi]MCX4138494.1 SDR family oxidoreductase [Paraburkholderia aspalathi]